MEASREIEAVGRYHERSKHRPARFAPGPGRLDWANQPDPFRAYAGAPNVELPLAGDHLAASWSDLHRPGVVAPRPLDLRSLGAFFELALGLTAWKEAPGARWALRANPSSGNLHPTEGYLLVPEVPGVPAGLYHYVSRDHALERRGTPVTADGEELRALLTDRGFLLGLASIHWREAWKYGERAFRYCQHDAGHALATARYAAAVLGWSTRLLGDPGDDDVAAILGLDRGDDAADLAPADCEHPDALVFVAPPAVIDEGALRAEGAVDDLVAIARRSAWAGRPNALSPAHVEWPEIDTVAEASRKPRTAGASTAAVPHPAPSGDAAEEGPRGAGETPAADLIRRRRSAVAMDGHSPISAAAFFAVLDRLLPRPGIPPWDVLPWAPRLHPVLFVHRVEGLAPGLYVLERDPAVHDPLRESLRSGLRWERPAGTPDELRLFLLDEGDARSFARLASCQQAIASDSAFSLGMLSVFEDEPARRGRGGTEGCSGRPACSGRSSTWRPRPPACAARASAATSTTSCTRSWASTGPASRTCTTSRSAEPVDDTRLATRPAYPSAVCTRG